MQALARPHDDPQLRRFRDLYREEFAFVWAVARRMGVTPAVADDVVQEVFLTAYRRLAGLQFEVSARAWLYGVTRRVVHRHRRSEARHARRLSALAEAGAPERAPPQQRHDDAQQLERLLAGLSERTREVWEMTELHGMSAPEIAGELALPLNTVYSRLRLARQQLQAQVAAPERLVALRDAGRDQQAPPREQAQRTWAALLPTLAPGKLAGLGLGALVSTRAAMATTLLAVGIAAAGVASSRGTSLASPVVAVAPALPVAAAAPVVVAEVPAPAPSAPPPEMTRRTGRAPGADDRLREEVALLDRADGRLAAGDPQAAIRALDEHARRFPAGTLADVREATRVHGLCAGGEDEAAERAAARIGAAYPGSAVAKQFDGYRCRR